MLEPLGRLIARPWADAVTGMQVDSRRIEEGDLFVAVGGGEDFVEHALARGASAALVPADAFAALAAIAGAVRERSHARVVGITGLDRQDVDEGHPLRALRAAPPDDRERRQLQHRDRRAVDALPDRGGHGDLHQRAGHARARADRLARVVRAARHRRDHERRPGPPRARRDDRERRPSEGRADRRAAARRHRDRARTSRCSSRTSTRSDISVRRVDDDSRRSRSGRPTRRRTSSQNTRIGDRSWPRCSACRCRTASSTVEFSKLREEELELPGGGLLLNDCYNANPMSMRAALLHLAESRGRPAARRGARRDGGARRRGARLPPRGRGARCVSSGSPT